MAETEKPQPKYLSRAPDDPIRLAQEQRAADAEEFANMTPRQQQLKWGKDKLTDILVAMRYGKRRTMHGFLENADEVTPAEKNEILDSIQACLDFCRQSISSTKAEVVRVPVPDFMTE